MIKRQVNAYIAIIIQAMVIGFLFLIVKVALKSANGAYDLLVYFFSLAAICVVIYRLIVSLKIHFSGKDLLQLILVSFSYPIFSFCFKRWDYKKWDLEKRVLFMKFHRF